tara:strand:+ start:72 stop:572 length:501 start_codon:yes stop_codon:yes gene_type:complete
MEKRLLILGIFSLLISNYVKANLQKEYNEITPYDQREEYLIEREEYLNQTNCSWENAQYIDTDSSNTRYCIDTEKNTIFDIFYYSYSDKFFFEREKGFLNEMENFEYDEEISFEFDGEVPHYEGEYFLTQWGIEGDKLYRYSCRTSSKTSTVCNGEIVRETMGIER